MKFVFPPFVPDSRGNRLEKAETRRIRDADDVRLYLCGPDEVAAQLEWVLQPRGAKPLALEEDQKPHWTHRIHVPGGLTDSASRLIALLKKVLTLTPKDGVDAAIALDFYTIPDSDPDPKKWKHTGAGSVVYAAKYMGHPEALDDLADWMVKVIRDHPVYEAADLVVAVPGHRSKNKSFSERLAEAVAGKLGKPVVRPTTASDERPAAKEREQGSAARNLDGEFAFDGQVEGRVLIVIDDVCRSGSTMSAIAKAAKEAGAVSVLALVGAQTLRR